MLHVVYNLQFCNGKDNVSANVYCKSIQGKL